MTAPKSLFSKISASFDAVASLDGATTPRALGSRLLDLTAQFGVVAVIAGVLPAAASDGPADVCANIDCWREAPPPEPDADTLRPPLFLAKGCAHVFERGPDGDEILHRFVGLAPCLSTWIERADGLAFRLVCGADGDAGLVFVGPSRDDPEAEKSLAFIAPYAFARMMKIDRISESAPRLSERQIVVLKWAAEGKTDQEIAALMHVSGHTVDKYMRQGKEALDAVNRTSAIVAAMRWGLIA